MRKLILTCVVLLAAVAAGAQTKVAPKLVNGFKAVYTEEMTIEAGGSTLKVTEEEEYVVSNVTATGATITVTTSKVTSNASDDENQLLLIPMKAMEGVSVKLGTSAEGEVKKVENIAEVKAAVKAKLVPLVDKFLSENSDMEGMVSKEMLMQQFEKSINEETLLESVKSSGVLALNGKEVKNGASENFLKEGIKMKRMYFVMGKNVVVSSQLDMTKDEIKALIIKQVEEAAPEQAEVVKQNIDMVMGQMKFEATDKATYILDGANGWVSSIKSEATSEILGQTSKQSAVVTLKK